jgi:hypothetical protein
MGGEIMKKEYEAPDMEIDEFIVEDICDNSGSIGQYEDAGLLQ